ncbi:MAG: B12-binding domain-containing radical SAM protein [Acidithiobacillales bacterium]
MTTSEKASRARLKVVLYNPKAVFFTMPLGVLSVASHLPRDRYEVVLVDGRLEADPVGAVLSHLDGAICLGVSVLTGAPIHDAITICRAVKSRRPDLPVVWGGWHPSLFGRGCLEERSLDVTVQAQGEETFREILDRLDGGSSLDGCAGCAYRAPDGSAVQNSPRAFADLNSLSAHDYGLLPVERYFVLKGKRQLDYITSQGCFFRCAFCADPYVYGRKWVGLSPARVGEELGRLWKQYRFTDVNFQDETYFTYSERVEAIAEEIISRRLPITWAATMRADQAERLTEDVMATCRRSGLRRVIIGVESGSQATIDRIKKDITLEQVFASAEKCRRHGVAVYFPFIVGFPNESDESVRASLDVARRLRAMSPAFETPFYYFKPYPGTPLTDQAEREGYRSPRTLKEWADFDWYDSAGPWVSPERHRLVERYKFYQRIGYEPPRSWKRPVQKLARWRVERNRFGFPVEKVMSQLLSPPEVLS